MKRYEAWFDVLGHRATRVFEAPDIDEANALAKEWADAHWPCDLVLLGELADDEADDLWDLLGHPDGRHPEDEPEQGEPEGVPAAGRHDEAPREVHGLGALLRRCKSRLEVLLR